MKDSTGNIDYEMIGKDIQSLQELIDQLEVVYEEQQEENNTISNEIANEVIDANVITNEVVN